MLKNDGTAPTQYLANYTFYDKRGRVIQTQRDHHLSGNDIIWQQYNFAGWLLRSRRQHQAVIQGSNKAYTINERFTYDHTGRVIDAFHQIGDNAADEKRLSTAVYNEKSELHQKKLHLSGGSNYWQTVDYGYNIRGWLTSINDFASSSDLFALQLTYGEGDVDLTTAYEDGNHANWNGNITMMEWKVKNHAQRHAYGFFYDRKNRLTSTTYSNRNAAGYFDWTYQYITSYSYDGNGNLLQLYRNGYLGSGLYGPIDNLTYTYTANGRLSAVQELGHLQRGFKTGSANGTYTYDGNGSLQSDGHKGISSIAYHHHQLPRRINWGNGNWLELTYDAAGVKRSQTTSTGSPVHYVEGIVYSGSTLRYLLHAEGQVAWVNNAYRYEYVLSDHLGNRRVYFSDTNGDGVGDVLEENHFYPFGQALESDYFVGGANPYRYNGKERVDAFDLGWYDYGARWYAAELGRWGSVDPLAEKYLSYSPYNYVINNPLRYTDPNGMEIIPVSGGVKYTGEDAAAAYDDIILRGKNNSSVRIKTDQVNANVYVGSIIGDFGGKYTLAGGDILIASLDLVGIVDPTGLADALNAMLQAKKGEWAGAIISSFGLIPYAGDLAKVGKIQKDIKVIQNAIDAIRSSTKLLNQFNSAESLIQGAGNLTKVKAGLQGFVKGDGPSIFKAITQGSVGTTSRGGIIMKDGTTIFNHFSTKTGVYTIDINKAGELYKIRIMP